MKIPQINLYIYAQKIYLTYIFLKQIYLYIYIQLWVQNNWCGFCLRKIAFCPRFQLCGKISTQPTTLVGIGLFINCYVNCEAFFFSINFTTFMCLFTDHTLSIHKFLQHFLFPTSKPVHLWQEIVEKFLLANQRFSIWSGTTGEQHSPCK